MRDMNQELWNTPYDQELQLITGPFGTLLREIVDTIDQHGLKRRYLDQRAHLRSYRTPSITVRMCPLVLVDLLTDQRFPR